MESQRIPDFWLSGPVLGRFYLYRGGRAKSTVDLTRPVHGISKTVELTRGVDLTRLLEHGKTTENGRLNPSFLKISKNFLLKIIIFQRFSLICVEKNRLVELTRSVDLTRPLGT